MSGQLPAARGEVEVDTRMVVRSGVDEDGEPNDRPWLSLKDDNSDPPK